MMIDINMNSMLKWWPTLKALADSGVIKVPATLLFPLELDVWSLLDGKALIGWDDYVKLVKRGAEVISPDGPVFLRTGHTSDKHDWVDTCYVDDYSRIGQQMFRLIEFSACVGIIGLPVDCFVVREFLPLNAKFTAFNGMPIAREFRIFCRDGKVEHCQFYWPKKAILEPSVPDWEQRLDELSELEGLEQASLYAQACAVSKAIGGYWSIDFTQHEDGSWYVTDMALGECSYDTRKDGE